MNGFDTAEDISGITAQQVSDDGMQFVGLYLRPDRTPLSAVQAAHAAGLKVFSIFEKGYPTSAAYFTEVQGTIDASHACSYAVSLGQPSGTTISPCVDYDSNPEDVQNYLMAFHNFIKTYGYHSLPYGNGVTLEWAIENGYAIGGWLSQSTGFQGYEEFKSRALMAQGPSGTVCGFDSDVDLMRDGTEGVLW